MSSVFRRWCAPDLALAFSVFTLFYCLFVYDGPRRLFRDSDSGWHIRTGEAILAGSGLPRSDPYSFSRASEPWFAWEWGAGVIMGAAHRWQGLTGVALLYAAAIAACSWLWVRLHWAAGGDFLLACALASPMLSTVNLHWLARPHVFGWLFLLGAVWYAEARGKNGSPLSHLPWIALFTALWANLHASFFLAPVLALLYAVAAALRPMIWDLPAEPERRAAGRFLTAAAASGLGSLANPYGWELHRHVAAYLADRELLARVGEFQSFNFHSEGAFQILLAAAIAATGAVLALGQGKLGQALLAALLLAGALRSARGLPLAALVLLPLANGAISEALRGWRGLRPGVRRGLDRFLGYSARLRALDRGLGGAALAPAVLLLAFAALQAPEVKARTGFPPGEFPVEAASAVAQLPADARLLAPDKFGGYLIYRFEGRRKVFFDGRSDFYGSGFMQRYVRLVQVRPGWREQVEALAFTHALLPNDYSLLEALETAGWKRLHRDATATLLERGRK